MQTHRIRGMRPVWRLTITLGLLSALALLRPVPAAAGSSMDPEGGSASANEHQAVTDMRNAGSAMYWWYKDKVQPGNHHEEGKEADYPKEIDVSKIPVIAYQDLRNLLVPKYIKTLPETDPWGRPYEYRLNTQDLHAQQIMAIRTGGADGQFAGNVYKIGPFPPTAADQDLVWVDGYFARWPKARGK